MAESSGWFESPPVSHILRVAFKNGHLVPGRPCGLPGARWRSWSTHLAHTQEIVGSSLPEPSARRG